MQGDKIMEEILGRVEYKAVDYWEFKICKDL